MISHISTVDTTHEDLIHDAQFDYYGTRLATCSSDRKIKVFDIRDNQQTLVDTLNGHDGAVWQVSWSHPMFGPLLASCGYDKKIIVWEENANGKWSRLYEYEKHESSVNSICWAPYEVGLTLAAGSSDGTISVISTSGDGAWDVRKISNAHVSGCNAVSWAPAIPLVSIQQPDGKRPEFVKRLVSGGCDSLVKIWREENDQWVEDCKLEGHSDWVRDVAWAPSIGLCRSQIASCSQDGRILIWTNNDDTGGNSWESKELHKYDDVVWSVSWSLAGDVLAVSGGDNRVSLWKQSPDCRWSQISSKNADTSSNTSASVAAS